MIVFFTQKGEIKGIIEGRIHDENHLKIGITDGEELQKLVIQWIPIRFYSEQGKVLPKGHPKIYTADFEPDHEQKDLIILFEKNPSEVYNYRIQEGIFIKK